MAAAGTRCLLLIWLVNLTHCAARAGPPPSPSLPDCFIPCDEHVCGDDIHCTWDHKPDPQIPTNYSLHWESASSKKGHVNCGNDGSGLILRLHISKEDGLRVWVQAENQYGVAKSQVVVVDPVDNIKPPPPIHLTWSPYEPSEIYWTSTCEQLHFSVGHCDVRHRAEGEQVWLEDLGGFQVSYTFHSLLPCTVYEFQVRCQCSTGLKSDWSEIQRIQDTESAPVGMMDVWRDYGSSATNSDCELTWKKLQSQACGHILGYGVRLFYNNGAEDLVNLSIAEPHGQLVCDEMRCCFKPSLKGVSAVTVTAYNSHGASVPSYLSTHLEGEEKSDQAINISMNKENLTVLWKQTSQSSDNLKEYVVQYNQAGCSHSQGFDWLKVDKSQITATFKGQFHNYTPYQVSLFSVTHNNEVHHVSSAIGFALQGAPPMVASFKVSSIADTQVTLLWEPIPLCKQNGTKLLYQIGVKGQNVYNVSTASGHEKMQFQLQNLSPEQEYDVWIGALTEAGRGPQSTIKFKTKHAEGYLIPVLLGVFILLGVCIAIPFLSVFRGGKKPCPLVPSFFSDRVPDPSNSHIFKQMKHQINDPSLWSCIPISEPHPKISLLEVVEIPVCNKKKTSDPDRLLRTEAGVGCSQMESQDNQRENNATEECHRTDQRPVREAYSKMIDSDEEGDGGEEREDGDGCRDSSDEDQCTSGYEQHFMPTAWEIQEV